MREPAPDYASRQYERPNQPWVCGLASDGRACPAGPTAGGACPALAECVPARDGDRWKCNRSALRGGICAEGPTPEGGCGCVHRCTPVRSLRSIRGRFVRACTLLAIGGLLIVLSANWRNEAISPGPLAWQHAQLLNHEPSPNPSLQGRGTCAACHSGAERSVAGWTVSLAALHHGVSDQSQRCMECHTATISKQFATAAHSVAPGVLSEITRSEVAKADGQGTGDLVEFFRRGEPGGSLGLACATCHREHQGAQFDLTAMNDAACQACHQQRYESFATDHPDFGKWPYERRTRIAFNHASHEAKHFAEKKQQFDCKTCHVEDASHTVQLTANYENACASCHTEKIATSVAKGVPMLLLPTLDVEALKTAGHDIGPWPEGATGDFDGRLPPPMKLLLAADPAAAEAMETLGPDFEFFDVDPDDPAQLEACAALALAMKKLFANLSASSSSTLRERLNAALEHKVPETELNTLLTGLPQELIQEAAQEWLGESNATQSTAVVSKATTEPAPSVAINSRQVRPIVGNDGLRFDPVGTWTRDDTTFSIRYQPSAHADQVLAGWLDLLTTENASTNGDRRDKPGGSMGLTPLAAAMFKELSSATAPGLCASCHSAERNMNGSLTVNWRASDRTHEPRTLTKFSHGPHLLLPQLADCASCHAINATANTAASYATTDPYDFVSEFTPLSKQQCVQCHTAKVAGESCQKCHNYHVDHIESWRLSSKVSRGGAEDSEKKNTDQR